MEVGSLHKVAKTKLACEGLIFWYSEALPLTFFRTFAKIIWMSVGLFWNLLWLRSIQMQYTVARKDTLRSFAAKSLPLVALPFIEAPHSNPIHYAWSHVAQEYCARYYLSIHIGRKGESCSLYLPYKRYIGHRLRSSSVIWSLLSEAYPYILANQ